MHRLRVSSPARSVTARHWPRHWIFWLSALVLVGIFFLMLTLFGLAGMLRLVAARQSEPTATPQPVLLVAPDLASLAAPSAPATPASAALQQLIASPLPTSLPTLLPTPTVMTVVAVTVTPSPVPADTPAVAVTYRALFEEIGASYGIDWRLLAALAFRESRLDPSAVGASGDMGLMQILPTTWDEFAPRSDAALPFDARHNVEVAATYLLYLQDKLNELGHGEIYWVLVAYNWGPNNVRRLLNDGGAWEDVPPRQRQYAADILEAAFGVRLNE